ncbi:uncharacterized protein F4822DRAFT_42697 [Hypoxylon trugodes]|uniref:uncharacterized protein n=1 Tax=Hypoxylon trugodes TaxID=326681 RepID=UPI002198A4B0|nr:uncharacterized protein F4822DRAFT_42697 [Hypoxylon trugodes]KAI1394240.1 hypothetical protein F4822DRAFT_42697 [Hypoxylon trugodes]
MSFFTGTTKFVNTSPIPATASNTATTKEAAVKLLHDHDFFLRCEPHYVSHRRLPDQQDEDTSAAAAKQSYRLPPNLEPLGEPPVKLYEVVDHVPNPVWSSSVVSREEFVDFKEGVWVRIRSPLAVVMETKWSIRERRKGKGDESEEGELDLVEEVEITCSKLLLSIVKAQVDNGWKRIHGKIIERLVEDTKEGGGEGKGE